MGGDKGKGDYKGGGYGSKGDKKGEKGDKKGHGKGDFERSGDFGKAGEGKGYGDKKGKGKGGDSKGFSKGGKGGGKGGDPIKLPVKEPPPLEAGTVVKTHINPYLFCEKAPSVKTRELMKDGAQDDAEREKFKAEEQAAKQGAQQSMDDVKKVAPGTRGEAKKYIANVVPILFEKGQKYYQYAIMGGISGSEGPITDRKKEKQALRAVVRESDNCKAEKGLHVLPASTGIIFTTIKMKADGGPDDPEGLITTLTRTSTGQEKSDVLKQTLKAKFKFSREISTDSITQEVVTLMACIFRESMERSNFQKIGRTYFNMESPQTIPRLNKQLVPGLHAALNCTDCGNGLSFTIDVVKKCIGETDAWKEGCNAGNWGPEPDLRKAAIQRQMKMMWEDTVMMAVYDNAQRKKRTVHIDEVIFTETGESAQQGLPDEQSLATYFHKAYGLQIPPGQPVLISKNRQRRDPKTGEGVIEKYLPSVLKLTGCPTKDPKTKPLREQMLRMCAVHPSKRYDELKGLFRTVAGPSSCWKELADTWGVSLQKGFMKLDGRALPKPLLQMSAGFTKDTSGGSWNFDIDKRPQNPNPFTAFKNLPNKPGHILVLCPESEVGVMGAAGAQLEKSLGYLADGRVVFKMEKIGGFSTASASEIAAKFKQFGDKADAFIVIADRIEDECYRAVKIESIITNGKPSQVIRVQTISDQKKLKAVCNKIATQILTKLGNSAWEIQGCDFKDMMVCGISFHHAGTAEGRRSAGSVAGICCSVNSALSRYTMAEVQLDPAQTVASGLASGFRKCLDDYKRMNGGKPPKQFVFFREGGPEGEVPNIVHEEVTAIKAAITEATGTDAKIAYWLVIRKSHIRLAEYEELADQQLRLTNPEFGALVDRFITHVKGSEFFIVSQKVDQGSAQAVKYKCLINDLGDEWNRNLDRFQELAFNLCNMYYNWNGPIAVPGPCLYASRHARMFGDQLSDKGTLLKIEDNSSIRRNCGVPCL